MDLIENKEQVCSLSRRLGIDHRIALAVATGDHDMWTKWIIEFQIWLTPDRNTYQTVKHAYLGKSKSYCSFFKKELITNSLPVKDKIPKYVQSVFVSEYPRRET